jgi:DNA ligase-associated metallophosphoesterase
MMTLHPSLDIHWHDRRLTLLHQRAVWHQATRTLIAADLHLGKADHFRAWGVPVPDAANGCTLQRLTDLLREYSADRLIVLGDFFHARTGITPGLINQLHRWRQQHTYCHILNLRGNHDHQAGDPPPELNVHCEQGPTQLQGLEPITLCHHHASNKGEATPTMAGHLHPATRIEAGREQLRLPCFWVQPNALILPAFGAFTGCAVVQPRGNDRIIAIGPGRLVDLTRPQTRPPQAAPR